MLSDRPELFFILNRITEGVTEFINCSKVDSLFKVYKFKLNFWVGIILREIYDLDSLFYQFKWHVINYLSSLVEEGDFQIISHIASSV